MIKLAIIIPTKDRPDTLARLLAGIRKQTRQPDQIIVVDGSDDPVENVLGDFPEMAIDYVRVYPPALTKQKNAGVANVNSDISLVGFVDDDIVFETTSFASMMSFWEGASDKFGGASFNITTSDPPDTGIKSLFKSAFFIANNSYGNVHRSGFNTSIWNTEADRTVRWLGGGYTVWRKKVFNELSFDEWFPGSGLWEDVLFSFNVGKSYDLAVVAGAKAAHYDQPISHKANLRLGKTQIVNWVHFVASNKELSMPMCLWGCVGRIAVNLSKGVASFDMGSIFRAAGNCLGLGAVALGSVNPLPSRRKI